METGATSRPRPARVAAALAFLQFGTVIGVWTARIPAIKAHLRLSDGQLALGLLAFAAGAITGQMLAGRILDRVDSRRVMVPAMLGEGVLLLLPALAPNLVTLIIVLFVFATAHGGLNVAMNANAVVVERAYRRPIMSSFHAVYSIGGFLGAVIGGLYAHAGASPTLTFATVTVAGVGLTLCAWRWAMAAPVSAPAPTRDHSTGTAGSLLLLGGLVFGCLVGEGAAADWGSVYLRDNLTTSAGFAASAYAAFSIMMMVGRLVGDRLSARLGPVTLVRGCGAVAALGLGTGLIVNRPIAGVFAFACLGLGLSCVAPQVFSAAGRDNPDRAGYAIARVASLGYLGFLAGPVLIGAVAELVGLPWALGLPALLALFVAGGAGALRPRLGSALGRRAQ